MTIAAGIVMPRPDPSARRRSSTLNMAQLHTYTVKKQKKKKLQFNNSYLVRKEAIKTPPKEDKDIKTRSLKLVTKKAAGPPGHSRK